MESWCRYSQSTGEYVVLPDDVQIGWGWAGCGEGKNNPDMQHVKNTGPLPRGWYTIGDPENASTGPYSLRLHPDSDNEMFGRDGFLIHGPALDLALRGQESHGCPILERVGRIALVKAGIKRFEVVL